VSVPQCTESINGTDEGLIFELLAEVLNESFMTELAKEFSTDRERGADDASTDSALVGKRFIVIGASHASRLANALEELGATIVDISVPGWKITESSVDNMKSELSSVLSEEFSGETFIIYQLYDNSMYWSCDEEGIRSLPVKSGDNKYHIPGRVVFVEREKFKELFLLSLSLLRAGQNHTKILLSPLMRYVSSGCCTNASHMINRREKNFAGSMGKALGEVGEWLQDFAFTRRIRNFAVLCPNQLCQGEGDIADRANAVKNMWSDPVHLTSEGYQRLAENLINRMLEVKLSRATEAKSATEDRIPDRAAMRPRWVTENDSSVRRSYEGGGLRGGSRGGHRGRGGFRGRGRGPRASRGSKLFPYQKNRQQPY
jgi:hypothetical protein